MKHLLLASAIVLSGCASTAAIMDGEPNQRLSSSKSVNAVAFCIANKNNTQAQDGPNGGKVVQVKNVVGAVGVLYEILPNGEGSEVTVRRANSPISFTRFEDCL